MLSPVLPMIVAMDVLAIAVGGAGIFIDMADFGKFTDRSCTSQLISFCVLYAIGFVLIGMGEKKLYRNKHSSCACSRVLSFFACPCFHLSSLSQESM